MFNVQHERDKEIKKERQVRHNQASANEQCIEPTEIDQFEVHIDDEASDSEFEDNSFAYHEKEDQELSKSEIPVDDDSPITVSTLLRNFIEKLPQFQMNFNLKLFFLIFAVLPIFLHLKLAVVFFYNLKYYQEISRKSHHKCVNDGQLLTFCFDTFVDFGRRWKLTNLGTATIISSVFMFLVIPFIKPKDLIPRFGQLIIEELKKQRNCVFDFTYYMLEL